VKKGRGGLGGSTPPDLKKGPVCHRSGPRPGTELLKKRAKRLSSNISSGLEKGSKKPYNRSGGCENTHKKNGRAGQQKKKGQGSAQRGSALLRVEKKEGKRNFTGGRGLYIGGGGKESQKAALSPGKKGRGKRCGGGNWFTLQKTPKALNRKNQLDFKEKERGFGRKKKKKKVK